MTVNPTVTVSLNDETGAIDCHNGQSMNARAVQRMFHGFGERGVNPCMLDTRERGFLPQGLPE